MLFAIAVIFVIWFGIAPLIPEQALNWIILAIAGWQIGGWVQLLTKKVFNDN